MFAVWIITTAAPIHVNLRKGLKRIVEGREEGDGREAGERERETIRHQRGEATLAEPRYQQTQNKMAVIPPRERFNALSLYRGGTKPRDNPLAYGYRAPFNRSLIFFI